MAKSCFNRNAFEEKGLARALRRSIARLGHSANGQTLCEKALIWWRPRTTAAHEKYTENFSPDVGTKKRWNERLPLMQIQFIQIECFGRKFMMSYNDMNYDFDPAAQRTKDQRPKECWVSILPGICFRPCHLAIWALYQIDHAMCRLAQPVQMSFFIEHDNNDDDEDDVASS